MKEQEFVIEGMSCNHCVMVIKKELSKLNLESFDVQIGLVKAMYDESKSDSSAIVNAITEAGYEVKQ